MVKAEKADITTNRVRKKFAQNFTRDYDRRIEDGEVIDNALVHAVGYAQALLTEEERKILVKSIREEA